MSNDTENAKTNFLTRSKPFKTMVSKAFAVCDSSKSGEVDKSELYAGLLLVHLKLAKYAGAAACYPPSKDVCDQLFDAADADKSGGINEQEFSHIMAILCAQILSRMFVYYVVLIMLVPYLSAKVVDFTKIPNGSYTEMAAEQIISLSLFFLVIPTIWNTIDERAEYHLDKGSSSISEGDEKTDTDKKDD